MERKKIRAWILFTIVLSIMFLFGLSSEVRATYVSDSNGITWSANLSGTIATSVYYYSGEIPDGKLEIPSTLTYSGREYTVTSITGTGTTSPICSVAGVTEIVVPDTVTSINYAAFYNMTSLKKVTIPSSVTSMSNSNCFRYCSSLETVTISGNIPITYIKYIYDYAYNLKEVIQAEGTANQARIIDGVLYDANVKILYKAPRQMECDKLVLPSTVTTINANAFEYTGKIKQIEFNEGLLSIGNYAFRDSKIEGNLNLPNSLTSIGTYAFSGCTNLTGDLIIPNSVTNLGSYSFNKCTGFKGKLVVGDGVYSIQYGTFWESNGFSKIIIGSSVTSIQNYNFVDLDDLWVRSEKGKINFYEGYCQGRMPFIHFVNDTHNIVIGSLPGIKVINVETGEEITSGDYECETSLKYRIEIAPGYNYQNLKMVEVINNDYDKYTVSKVETDKVYEIESLLRDRKILIQNVADGVDLSLRTFITEVNRYSVSKPRVPEVVYGSNGIEYRHTKNPLKVEKGDKITYKVRVYNEGIEATNCEEVSVYIPDGLTFVEDNMTNEKYEWKLENGVCKTSYLMNQKIGSNLGNGILKYKDLEIVLSVDDGSYESDLLKTVFAEITKLDSNDIDSTPGNVEVSENYKKDEIYDSNSSSYIKGQEDDDDFDTVVLNAKIKVEYNVKIKKIDSKTQESLRGAQFNLLSSGDNTFGFRRTDENGKEFIDIKKVKDGEIISTATSDEDGVVDFGGIMTFDEGSDCFTYEEVKAPAGYLTNVGRKTKVRVDKKIIDREKGTYTVKVYCEAEAVTVDTDIYEFTPVTNAEQLMKIGSGDNVVIDGVTYEYNMDTNYRLMNDIDLAGIDWKPINNELKCIIDGNGHKIKNLTIQKTEQTKIAEVGMIRVFSGIVKNLTFENPVIEISTISENAEKLTDASGIGVFAGVMKQGYIQNCKIIGSSARIEAMADNIGGFVGHTLEDGVLTILDSENNANIIAHSYKDDDNIQHYGKNIGGFIGCSKSSLEIKNSINKGQIQSEDFNAGGFVGYTNSSDYADMEVLVGFDEDNKTIDFIVENTRSEGDYNLTLEIRDQKTGDLIGGATYEIDKVDDVVKTALLDTGTLKLFDKVIHYTGRDIYFLTEDGNIDGYEKLNGIIKVEIERYWDFDDLTFKARANAELVSQKEYEQYEGDREKDERMDNGEAFDKGEIFTDVNLANVNWNRRKIAFDNCTNEGRIFANNMNAAGMIGLAYCTVDIKNCTNKGEILAGAKAGGIISEIRTVDGQEYERYDGNYNPIVGTENTLEYSNIANCVNNGKIETYYTEWMYGEGSTAGIVADCRGNIRIENSINNAVVLGTGYKKVGGILGQEIGTAIVDRCENNGELTTMVTNYSMGYSYHNNVAGGIIGQVFFNENSLDKLLWDDISTKITNCKNSGNINSVGKVGGMLGQAYGREITITDCETSGPSIDQKVELSALSQGECGGILAFTCSEYINLHNNKVIYAELENKSMNFGSTTSSAIGGIVAGVHGASNCSATGYLKNYRSIDIKKVNISDNKVISSNFTNRAKEIGGIMGLGIYVDYGDIKISDCLVENCNLKEINPSNSTYSAVGGITSGGYGLNNVDISYCTIKKSNIEIEGVDGNLGTPQSTAAGIFARCYSFKGDLNVTDCLVTESLVRTHTQLSTSGNTAGIVGFLGSIQGNVKILRTTIEKSTVTTYTENVAGMLGVVMSGSGSEGVILEDCNNIETSVIRACMNPYGIGTTYDKVGGIASYFQSISNGVKFRNCNVIGKDTTNEDERTVLSSYYGGIGGIYADDLSSDVEITNSTVKNIDIKMYGTMDINGCSYADLGGVNAIGLSKLKMKDVLVENCNVLAGYAKNVGGVVGYRNREADFENCDVKNVKVTNHVGLHETKDGWSTYGNAAGFACSLGSNTTMKDCDIKDIVVESGAIGAGGAVYWIGSNFIVNDCTVENVKLIDNYTNPEGEHYNYNCNGYMNYRPFGGFVANSGSSTWFNNVKVKNIECVDIKYGHLGGLAGYVSSIKQLTNCSVEGGNLHSYRCINTTTGAVGGMIADLCSLNGECSNNKVKDVTISTGVHLAGGLFGYFSPSDNNKIENCEVDNVNITHRNENYFTGDSMYESLPSVGGLISSTTGNVVINGCTVKNSSITGLANSERPLQVGGIAGSLSSASTINNCKVINTKIENKAKNSFAAGLIGILADNPEAEYPVIIPLTINNSSVEGNCVIKGISHVAGAVGQATLIGTNIEVKDAKIESNNDGVSQFGGLMAIGQSTSVLKNVSVKDTIVTDVNENNNNNYTHAGGIAGVFKGTIDGATISNVDVTAVGAAGGVAGICDSQSIKNATVTGGTITSKLSNAGGISGKNNNIIEGCTVTNTNVIAQDCAGGISGISMGDLNLNTVIGATVTSKVSHAAGLVACTTQNIENCTVKDTTAKLETLNEFNCVGGLVAAGMGNAPVMTNVISNNNTLIGGVAFDDVWVNNGKFIGAPTMINDNLIAAEVSEAVNNSLGQEVIIEDTVIEATEEVVKEEIVENVENIESVQTEEIKEIEEIISVEKEEIIESVVEESFEAEEEKIAEEEQEIIEDVQEDVNDEINENKELEDIVIDESDKKAENEITEENTTDVE